MSLEKYLAETIIDALKENNAKSISIYKALAEIEIAIIKHFKYDHVTKAGLAVALKINRTTLTGKCAVQDCDVNKDIEVKWVSVDLLKPHPKNPNVHSKEQIERLAQILRYQGFRSPIIVSNLSGYITVGHGRLAAAKLNGWDKVPGTLQDYDDETQEYAHIISDNSIADWATLDLAQINAEIPELGPDFDIDLLGIKDFTLEPFDKINAINRGDENSEWAQEMPDFEQGDKYIKLTFIFENEEMRQDYVNKHNVEVQTKRTKYSWLVYP